MAQKIISVIVEFLGKGGLLGIGSYLWCSADFWRKDKVKRYILSQKKHSQHDLPSFDTIKITSSLMDVLRTTEPLLIDGPSGSGKTSTLQELETILSEMETKGREMVSVLPGVVEQPRRNKYGTAFLSLRTADPETMTVGLAKQFGYVGKGAKHSDVSQALGCLREAIIDLYKEHGIITQVFIDDADRAFEYGKAATPLGKSLVSELGLKIADTKAGKAIFVTCDNFVFGEMRKIGGVEKRLEYFPFPTSSKEDYLKYIENNKEFYKKYTDNPKEDFDKFHSIFGSNMRSIFHFIKSGKSMQSFLKMRVGGEKNGLKVAMKKPECFNLLKRIAEGEIVFESDENTGNDTANLISTRLLRISWSPSLERSYYTTATPLIKYSLNELLKESYFKKKN